MGYAMRVIDLPDTILHLDKVLMTTGPRNVIYCRELITAKDIGGFDGIGFSCGGNTTANIICLGEGELIVNRSNTQVKARMKSEGYKVHDLDLSEFAMGMGGPNCLIMPIDRSA
jgi:N-dimethylarginine dimethylaminohydrolase